MIFMERSNTLLIILALGLVLTSLLLAYDGSDSAKTISVSGSSDVTVSPDKADVFVEVETRGETAEGVKNENSERMANVREALEEAGIAEDQIETQSFDIYPQQRWVSELEKSVVDGYIAEHSLKIEVLDIDDVGEIIDVVVGAGANVVNRVSFGLTKEKEIEINNRALELAALKAKEKAEALASTLGVKVGGIASISESNTNFVAYDFSPRLAMSEEAESTVINPKEVNVRGFVSVSFEIG